jgi:hypothetical protein
MDKVCPICHGPVAIKPNGKMFPHQRYIDGGGYSPGQDHTTVQCEGSDD